MSEGFALETAQPLRRLESFGKPRMFRQPLCLVKMRHTPEPTQSHPAGPRPAPQAEPLTCRGGSAVCADVGSYANWLINHHRPQL